MRSPWQAVRRHPREQGERKRQRETVRGERQRGAVLLGVDVTDTMRRL
jgi:hypothetical protein